MDQNTGLVVLGTAVGSKDLIVKLLGPTAEYLGDELQTFTQKRIENIKRIFKNAEEIAGDDLDEEGSIPPRVLKGVINEGSYINERLSSEYFGGVLASSRSQISRDDRGSTYISLLSRMSVYQIRTHYVFYKLVKEIFDGETGDPLNSQQTRSNLKVYLPISTYCEAMGFDQNEYEDRWTILSQSFHGLLRENLIDDKIFSLGPAKQLKKHHKDAEEEGIIFIPSTYGIELFSWAHGYNNLPTNQFLNPEVSFNTLEKISLTSNYCRAK